MTPEELKNLKYIIKIEKDHSVWFGVTDIVSPEGVTGRRQSNDSDDDYFDHYYVEESCFEDMCSGFMYYPTTKEANEYFKVLFNA